MEKSEHFLTRGYEKKKIKKSRLRAFARTRAKKRKQKPGKSRLLSSTKGEEIG